MLAEEQDVAVILYNSLGWTQDRVIEIQLGESVASDAVSVTNSKGELIESQRLYYGEEQETNSSLFFVAQVSTVEMSIEKLRHIYVLRKDSATRLLDRLLIESQGRSS